MHCFTGLQDGMLANQLASCLRISLAAKPTAAWHLIQRLALASQLSEVLFFSSIAGFLGSSGQASYAAANTSLDALAASCQDKVRIPCLIVCT